MSADKELLEILKERILVTDGAMGTMIQNRNLAAEDFGGPELEGCNEHLVLSKPEVISSIHEGYLKAGADINETDTFGATSIVLAEYGLQDKALEINKTAAELAVRQAKKYSSSYKPRFVAGSMGPGTKTISVTRNISFDEVRKAFAEQAEGLLLGGAQLLYLETQQDTLNIKASLFGIEDAFGKLGRRTPVVLMISIEVMGTMLVGQNIEALYISVENKNLLALGMNCATGPDFMTDHIRTLAQISRFPVACMPNAGLPDEEGRYHETPESLARKLERFCQEGWVNILGGCCGTTPEHIRLLSEMAANHAPRKPQTLRGSVVSGLEPLAIEEDRRPVLVGERTNVIGSKLFKDLIVENKYEEASEIGRRQVRNGAQVIDVCTANPDRNEKEDMIRLLDHLTQKIKAPLMIDSTDASVIEEALKKCPGKAIVNSINLEDGEERFELVVPLLKTYGAAVVVGCIDEDKKQGMAVTRQRKLDIAKRSYTLLTEKYGLSGEDLIFDALVFPAGTGDKNYVASAPETIEAVHLIKKELPRAKTILGISNVSFGLPAAGREVLNAVYLHHCVKAGLDLAIVNSEKLARFSALSEEEKKICEDLLFWKGEGDPAYPAGFDPVAAFAAFFRKRTPASQAERKLFEHLPVHERLARKVVEGTKERLIEDLGEILKAKKPLEIINGPLMAGMAEVGRLFANNDLIVAEVLQSAEVMKAAVTFLEPHMDKASTATKGKIVLATVKGDVHDIGKNLVHIIFKNNGFDITDLGIKVIPETLIKTIEKVQPDAVGLSGLLVKSAQQMVATATDLTTAGIRIPMLVGGAALTAKFTASKIAPQYEGPVFYAKDAMHGLDIANQLADPAKRHAAVRKNAEKQVILATPVPTPQTGAPEPERKKAAIAPLAEVPVPPDLKRHVVPDYRVEEIFNYLNPIMLYGKHLGLRGGLDRLLKEQNAKALELHRRVQQLQEEILADSVMKSRAVYQFFPAQSDGDSILFYDSNEGSRVLERFDFPRQKSGEGLCLADFLLPKSSGKMDYVALFVVTCGKNIRELSEKFRDEGEYLKSHALQAVAIESAEAFAELLHEKVRAMWGFKDPPALTLKDKFQARYRGLRVSFGYPACPNLEDQAKLFSLLEPEKNIGVELTEGFMMSPEASVSALVFHHPDARYFSVNLNG